MVFLKEKISEVVYSDLAFRIFEELSWFKYKKLIEELSQDNNLKLHLGAGGIFLDGWINIDMWIKSPNLKMKLPEGLLRFDQNSSKYIYTSHFLEHIGYPNQALSFVKECYRVLMPRGVLRIVVPGIEPIIRAYVSDDQDYFAVQAKMHPQWCTTKLEHLMYALQDSGNHQYGYDFETIQKLLKQAGFSNIYESDYNQSEFSDLRIDYRSETDNHGNNLSLYVDAVK